MLPENVTSKKVPSSPPGTAHNNNLCPLKVFVRVRPFMQREIEEHNGATSIIEMPEPQSSVITTASISENETKRETFTFERCFNGALRGGQAIEDLSDMSQLSGPIDQASIYAHVGLPVLRNVLDGYNGCVLAYGQTGSGKTFTMMGPPAVLGCGSSSAVKKLPGKCFDDFSNELKKPLEGIIPRLVRDLFNALHKKRMDDETHSFKLELEYLEIYKEKVMDLLSSTSEDSLRVRQHSERGPYVEGLTRKQVASAEEVFKWIKRGNIERHTGITKRNDRSSRSHAILTLHLVQMRFTEDESEGMSTCVTSKLNLVDLAGSERAAASGASGLQLQEANKINTSLTTLGRVIDSLADISQGKTGVFCPYRDSTLTWLLMDSIGGNSKTTLIATVSPHPINYEETSQTLRYASRAKQIVAKVSVNEDPQLIKIRELTAEIKRLQNLVQGEDGRDDYVEELKDRIHFLEEQVAERDIEAAQLRADLEAAQEVPVLYSRNTNEDTKHTTGRNTVKYEQKRRNSAQPVDLAERDKEIKKQESIIESLRQELRASKKTEKELLKELKEYRNSKQAQIQRAVVAERDYWEDEIASLMNKLRESRATVKEQDVELRRWRKHSTSATTAELALVTQNSLTEVVTAARTANQRLAVESHEVRELQRGRTKQHGRNTSSKERRADASTASRDRVPTAVNTTPIRAPHATSPHRSSPKRRSNANAPRWRSPAIERHPCTTPRALSSASKHGTAITPKRYTSPAFERYALMTERSSLRTTSAPAKDRFSTSKAVPTPRAVNSARSRELSAAARDTPGPVRRATRAAPGPVSRLSREPATSRERKVEPPARPGRHRTESLPLRRADLQKEFDECRSQAGWGRMEQLNTIRTLRDELQRVSLLLSEERVLRCEAEAARKYLETNRILDGLDEQPNQRLNEATEAQRRMEEKLEHAQTQVDVLRRILAARDRIYDEVNKIGVNPACFTEAILNIEKAARSQWKEEEEWDRQNIVRLFKLHAYYSPIVAKLKSEIALLSQTVTTEKNRTQQLCKDLDNAHAENEALQKANETVLKKIHFTKNLLKRELEKTKTSDAAACGVQSDLAATKKENERLMREVENTQDRVESLSHQISHLQNQLQEKTEAIQHLEEQISMNSLSDEKEISALAAELASLRSSASAKAASLNAELQKSREEHTKARDAVAEERSTRSRAEADLSRLEETLANQKIELEDLRQHVKMKVESEKELLIRQESASRNAVNLKLQLQDRVKLIESLQEEQKKLELEHTTLIKTIDNMKQDMSTVTSEYTFEQERLQSQLKASTEKLAKVTKDMQQRIAEKEAEFDLLREAQERILKQCATLEGEKSSSEQAAHQRAELLEAQMRALKKSNQDLELTVSHLREEISIRESEIQEFMELKLMQAHLDRLEEQDISSGRVSSSVTQSLNKFSSLIQGKLFKRKNQSDQQDLTNQSFSHDEDALSNSSLVGRPQEASIHTMLAAKMECGTGFRKDIVPQRTRRTPSLGFRRTAASAAEEPVPTAPLQSRRTNIPLVPEKRSLSRPSLSGKSAESPSLRGKSAENRRE